jgi:hypothetical protein
MKQRLYKGFRVGYPKFYKNRLFITKTRRSAIAWYLYVVTKNKS